jgi:hypothetical protein
MDRIKRKSEIRAWVLPPLKENFSIDANEMGFSESSFVIYLYNFWLERSDNPLKLKGDVTKFLNKKNPHL